MCPERAQNRVKQEKSRIEKRPCNTLCGTFAKVCNFLLFSNLFKNSTLLVHLIQISFVSLCQQEITREIKNGKIGCKG